MPNREPGARSFLLRALPERPSGDGEAATWRGYVVALPNGTPRYFERLAQIPEIVAALLASEEPDGAAVSDE